jgi:hypothetical protein
MDNLEEKVKNCLTIAPGRRDKAAEILKAFKEAPVDVKNTMKFVSWYYGVHVPVVVITFNKGQRAVDMCDDYHVITHMIMFPATSRGLDSNKQQAGRCKTPIGKLLQCNLPADFRPTIVCNVNLSAASDTEKMPFHNRMVDGIRQVPSETKAALTNNNVLDKACRRYEPNVRMLRAIGEEPEIEEIANGPTVVNHNVIPEGYVLELKDYTQGGKIGIHLMTNAANIYTKEELAPICDRISGTAGFVSRWINDMNRLHVLTKLDDGTCSINKHVPLVVKSKAARR